MKTYAILLACCNVLGPIGPTTIGQSEIEFAKCEVSTDHETLLTLRAPAGAICRIETSADLAGWQALVTLTSGGISQHTDSTAPFLAGRFYRACQLAETNVLTGEHLDTTEGDVVIHPVNHASLVLAWSNLVIHVDPVGASNYKSLPKANLILITHDHSDHLDASAINQNLAENGIVGAPIVVYNKLSAALRNISCVLTNGAITNLAGLTVQAVPAYNTNSSPFHPRGTGNGYVLTTGGRRIYISGDTHNTPEMHALKNIDVAFLAMNQPYTMTVTMAVNAVRAFRPRIVYPYHYRAASGYPATDLESFKRQVKSDPGVEVRLRQWYRASVITAASAAISCIFGACCS